MAIYQIYPQRKRNFFSALSLNGIIILVDVIAFFLFLLFLTFYKENPEFLYDLIALKPSNILHGKYLWTFLTSMFMHGGFFHLFANMISLLFIGSLVEKIIGRKRYFWFYLISGLFAGLFFVLLSLIFASDMNTYAVGASGALFGLVGLLVLLTPNLSVYIFFIPIPVKMKYAGPGILVLLWVISGVANIGIGNTAHLGGLLAGLVYGTYLRKKYPNKTRQISRIFS